MHPLLVVDSYKLITRFLKLSQGRAFNAPPGPGSVSAQVRSIADRNEALGLPPVMNPGSVYVTKEDASEMQSAESRIFGGQVPKGSTAAQMQVSQRHSG